MASKYQFITELYNETLLRVTGSRERWTGFLRAACYNYKCPFDEQILIYAQRPDATAVLELDRWNGQFGRWVNKGAAGIAVLDEARGKGRLKYYFDVADTHETQRSRPLPIWTMDEAYTGRVIETLENSFGTLADKGTLAEAVLSASHNAVADNLPDYLRDLKDCRADSLLEELDELNVEVFYRRALESSIAYMLLTRLGLPADDYFQPEDFSDVYNFNTRDTINALGVATSDIAEMGLREISRTVLQARRERFFAKDAGIDYDEGKETESDAERSEEHGTDLQNAGGLSDPQPAVAAGAGDAFGQVRGAAPAIPDEAPPGALHQPENELPSGGASGGGRTDGRRDSGAPDPADGRGRGRDGGAEGGRPAALDGPHEQPPAQRGGDGAERPDLQLTPQEPEPTANGDWLAEGVPSVRLNIAEKAGSDELPAFLDAHLMEAIVLDEGGRTVRRQQIFDFFQQHRSLDERRDFLKNAYTDTYVEILVDGVRVGYRGRDNGLLMWAGSYLSRTAESVFSWSVVAELTENLMERGAYKIKLGLQNAPVMAEQMTLFGAGGQMPVYEPYEAAPPLFPSQGVPQAVIDKALYTAGNESGSASRVAAFYMREHPEKENALFLRREFGTENGRGIEHEGRKYAVWFMEDGIHLARGSSVRTGYDRTTVTWEQASARILELLNAGTYLSQAELEQVPDKALREMANALIFTARDLTEEGRAQGLLAQTLAVYDERRAFPDCTNALADRAKDKSFVAQLAQEYHRFLFAYESDRSVLRYLLSEYNTHRIGIVLNGRDYDERHFEAKPDFLRQCKMFITQDEIDRFFLGGDVNNRLDVYAHFCETHTPQEHQEYIKDDFGEYSGGSRDGYDYTKTRKGLTYKREYEWKTYDTVQLTIPNVVKEYQMFLAQKRFPGEDALAAIPQYEKERLARTVYFAFSGLNGDVPRPYPENADFYSAVPAIQTQLTDPAQVQTMRETLSAALDTLAENDRCYDCVRNAKEQLSALEDGSFSLFNHRHEGLAAQLSGTLSAEPESIADPEVLETPASEPEPIPQELAEPEPILPPVPRQRDRVDATEPLYRNGINYRITDDALGAGTPSERFANNLAAIRLLKAIEQENRSATAEEQETLAKYVGWGGLADCFDEKNSRYAELKSLLSDTEYTAARESTLTAFYTPPVVIRSIYQALEQMGFTQGNILDIILQSLIQFNYSFDILPLAG